MDAEASDRLLAFTAAALAAAAVPDGPPFVPAVAPVVDAEILPAPEPIPHGDVTNVTDHVRGYYHDELERAQAVADKCFSTW